ncbi:MAG: hypothetical protein AAFP82_12030, partial [Bacteroidota bacterium]
MKLFHISLFLLVALCWQCSEDANNADRSESSDTIVDNLPPEQEDFDEAPFKWGYINRTGSLVIPT